MKPLTLAFLATATATACTSSDPTPTDTATALQQLLERRYRGDRTSVCVAAAVIEQDIQRAVVCADPAHPRALDGTHALEIGSISKTMTAALLAELIDQGKLRLSDPVARHLPTGTVVPSFEGSPITLAHLVTHTSGLPALPSRMQVLSPDNPYRDLTEAALLASLADVELAHAPGARWAYSNYGGMLLSYVVARVAGTDFESFAHDRLFAPLGMRHAYVARVPADAQAVAGHRPTGEATSPWDFPATMAGVGGVRATLDDMIRYAEANLGRGDAHTAAVLATTHDRVDLGVPPSPDDPEMAMGWIRLRLSGRTMLAHDGGTGGFSSFLVIDPDRDRAIVLLADTSLGNLGGLTDVALHLLDPSQPLPPPRTVATPSRELIQALVGRYEVFGFEVTLAERNGALVASLPDGVTLELAFDSHGDFFPREVDALMTPVRAPDGTQSFLWTQGGAPGLATRLGG